MKITGTWFHKLKITKSSTADNFYLISCHQPQKQKYGLTAVSVLNVCKEVISNRLPNCSHESHLLSLSPKKFKQIRESAYDLLNLTFIFYTTLHSTFVIPLINWKETSRNSMHRAQASQSTHMLFTNHYFSSHIQSSVFRAAIKKKSLQWILDLLFEKKKKKDNSWAKSWNARLANSKKKGRREERRKQQNNETTEQGRKGISHHTNTCILMPGWWEINRLS